MSRSSLHLLRTSPFQDNQLNLMLSCLTENDTVVLIDDGCYLNNHGALESVLEKVHTVLAIDRHMSARALAYHPKITQLSLSALNELLFTHKNSVTWQ